MQYLDDDMDEVFRKAAEGYPLNTGAADWDAVYKQLSPKNEHQPAASSRRRFLWLLLLLPLAFICNRTTDALHKEQPNGHAQANTSSTVPKIILPQAVDKQSVAATPALETASAPSTNGAKRPGAILVNETQARSNGILSQRAANPRALKNRKAENDLPSATTTANEVRFKTEFPTSSKENKTEVSATTSKSDAAISTETIVATNRQTATAMPDSTKDASAQLPPPDVKKAQKRFYIGIAGGPDVSTVKFRRFSEVGYGAGFIAGYEVSRTLSIEAGIFTSKKYYYSRGVDFNSAKLYLPYNTKIVAVNGNCRMLELPLSLHYNFQQSAKHSWFAAAGLSSYLMKTEAYDYDYLYTSSGAIVTHSKTYEDESKNWLSILQLSMGYNASLGRAASLRIEPYYALPLRGIGYGKLPLTSLGIRLGVTSKRF